MTKQEIARHNGSLSQGPKTAEGKAISSQNARKHGLTSSKMFVLQNENPESWEELLAECRQIFQPTNGFEARLVEEIANAKWRLRRIWSVENAAIDLKMDEQSETFQSTYVNKDEAARQAFAMESLVINGPLNHYGRYQTRLERSYERAVRSLRQIREQQKLPNEPTK